MSQLSPPNLGHARRRGAEIIYEPIFQCPLRRLCNGSPSLSDEFIWGYRAHGQYKRGRGHDVDHHQLFCEPFYIPHYAANARRV